MNNPQRQMENIEEALQDISEEMLKMTSNPRLPELYQQAISNTIENVRLVITEINVIREAYLDHESDKLAADIQGYLRLSKIQTEPTFCTAKDYYHTHGGYLCNATLIMFFSYTDDDLRFSLHYNRPREVRDQLEQIARQHHHVMQMGLSSIVWEFHPISDSGNTEEV